MNADSPMNSPESKANAAYDPEEYWDTKARSAADAGAAVRIGDPLLDRCIERSQRVVIERALRLLSSNSVNLREMTVLDFGCGTGQWSGMLSRRFGKYVGVDISNVMLDSSKNSHPPDRFANVDFQQVRDSKIPQDDDTFDVVISLAVLHHNDYADQARLLMELCRVLRHGGWMFVFEGVGHQSTDPNSHSFYRPIEEWKSFYQQHDLQVVGTVNCRYALLWYLCERFMTRVFGDSVLASDTSLYRQFRSFVLRIDAMLSPTLLRCTPNRLAGRCGMLLQLSKTGQAPA